jgi:hypothetical protein
MPLSGTNSSAPSGSAGTPVITNLTAEQILAMLQQQPQQLPGPSIPPNNYTAFGSLVNETKSWSDIQTIKLDNSSQAQVVVTFLSPQIIQTVYYNEVSSSNTPVTPNPQPVLDAIAMRDELLFFVTVITTTNNNLNTAPHKIRIPIQEMVIVNAEDVMSPPLRDDHNLTQEINSSYAPVFGYLTYPIAMMNGTECKWILNPDFNKKIVITVPNIYVDGITVGSVTWVIPYSPLFTPGSSSPTPSVTGFDTTQTNSSLTPPSPMATLLIPNGLNENIFWQNYARFLWRQVVLGH